MSDWDSDADDESIGEIILQLEDNNNDYAVFDDVINDLNLGGVNDVIDNMALDGVNYRSLGPGTSPLCRLMEEHTTNICVESGYVGNVGYVVPLHQISIVPGHTTNRIGVCTTGTTKLGDEINVRCHLAIARNINNMTGSTSLSNVLKQVNESMLGNDMLPTSFSTIANMCDTEKSGNDVMDMDCYKGAARKERIDLSPEQEHDSQDEIKLFIYGRIMCLS